MCLWPVAYTETLPGRLSGVSEDVPDMRPVLLDCMHARSRARKGRRLVLPQFCLCHRVLVATLIRVCKDPYAREIPVCSRIYTDDI